MWSDSNCLIYPCTYGQSIVCLNFCSNFNKDGAVSKYLCFHNVPYSIFNDEFLYSKYYKFDGLVIFWCHKQKSGKKFVLLRQKSREYSLLFYSVSSMDFVHCSLIAKMSLPSYPILTVTSNMGCQRHMLSPGAWISRFRGLYTLQNDSCHECLALDWSVATDLKILTTWLNFRPWLLAWQQIAQI